MARNKVTGMSLGLWTSLRSCNTSLLVNETWFGSLPLFTLQEPILCTLLKSHPPRIWYIFPQPAVLGTSENAVYYGLKSRAEAEGYLDHRILGGRLRALVQTAIDSGADVESLFPSPQFSVDRAKFRACLTLFALIDRETDNFLRSLTHFKLQAHPETLAWFGNEPVPPPARTRSRPQRLAVDRPAATPPREAPEEDFAENDISSYGSDRSSEGQWEEMELEAVTDSRYRRNVLQYRVTWKKDHNDKRWYSAKNLRQAPLRLDEFHRVNPDKAGPPMNIDIWRQCYFRGQRAPKHHDKNRTNAEVELSLQ